MPIKTFFKIIKSNISFFVLVLGAGSNFLLTLYIKKAYSQDDFNTFSLFITFIGIISSFGLIGFDQVFLRLANVKMKQVEFNKDLIIYTSLAFVFAPLALSLYFFVIDKSISLFIYFLIGLGVNAVILSYNFFRLTKKFSESQFFKSGFRFLVLTVIGVSWIIDYKVSFSQIVLIYAFFILLFAVAGIRVLKKGVFIKNSKTNNLGHFILSYGFNLAIVTVLGFGDRILILEWLSLDDFSKYFYYATIFLFPLTLIQQYVGFKELVFFKESFDKKLLLEKIRNLLLLGVFILLVIGCFVVIDNGNILEVNFRSDLTFIILMAILGLVKLIYGIFSALLGAVGKSNKIYRLNTFTVILILLVLLCFYFVNVSLEGITSALILVYLTRCIYIYFNYGIDAK